ncbi:MAG: energy transducer TonB [Chitinophagales bacterium]
MNKTNYLLTFFCFLFLSSCFNDNTTQEDIVKPSNYNSKDAAITNIEKTAEKVEDEVYQPLIDEVEEMPLFGGCEAEETKVAQDLCHQQELIAYLSKITYPPLAKEMNIEGKVFIQFIIDETGKVTDVEVAKGVDNLLNDAALKHIQNMPDWHPVSRNGKFVAVEYAIPINFVIQ